MFERLAELHPVWQVVLPTLFTWGVTALLTLTPAATGHAEVQHPSTKGLSVCCTVTTVILAGILVVEAAL